jgi:hypothetical protein
VDDIVFGTANGPTRLGPFVGDVGRLESGIANRLLHCHVIPRRAFREETHGAPVDYFGGIERRCTADLRAKAHFGIFFDTLDARPRLIQACKHFLGVVSDG